jgi:hypothetical protein
VAEVGSRNHEKSNDEAEALQWINETNIQPTGTSDGNLIVISLMILTTILITVPNIQSQKLAVQALESYRHQDHLKTLYNTDTSLSPETWILDEQKAPTKSPTRIDSRGRTREW